MLQALFDAFMALLWWIVFPTTTLILVLAAIVLLLDHSKQRSAGSWKRAIDSKTGRPYYYNTVSRKSSWSKPQWEGEDHSEYDSDQTEGSDNMPLHDTDGEGRNEESSRAVRRRRNAAIKRDLHAIPSQH